MEDFITEEFIYECELDNYECGVPEYNEHCDVLTVHPDTPWYIATTAGDRDAFTPFLDSGRGYCGLGYMS